MSKAVHNECSECGTKYSVISDSSESLAFCPFCPFCPFCGDGVLMPFDATDEDFEGFPESLNHAADYEDPLEDD